MAAVIISVKGSGLVWTASGGVAPSARLVFHVSDPGGNPVAGASIVFSLISVNGYPSNPNAIPSTLWPRPAITDSSGNANVSFTPATSMGSPSFHSYVFLATVGTTSFQFFATDYYTSPQDIMYANTRQDPLPGLPNWSTYIALPNVAGTPFKFIVYATQGPQAGQGIPNVSAKIVLLPGASPAPVGVLTQSVSYGAVDAEGHLYTGADGSVTIAPIFKYPNEVLNSNYDSFKFNIVLGDYWTYGPYFYNVSSVNTGELGPHNLTSNTSTLPYVVTASSGQGWMAFDGDKTSLWLGQSSSSWLAIDLGSPKLLGAYAISITTQKTGTLTRTPNAWDFQASTDGIAWVSIDSQTQIHWTTDLQTQTFTLAAVAIPYRYYKLFILANNGDSTYCQVSELYLYQGVAPSKLQQVITFPSIPNHTIGDPPFEIVLPTSDSGLPVTLTISGGHSGANIAPINMTDNTTPPYVALASSEFGSGRVACSAFNGTVGDAGTDWLGTGGGVDWLQIDLGANSLPVGSYGLAMNTHPEPPRAPKDWTFQGSLDGIVWVTLDAQAAQTGWASGETRTFTIMGGSVTYRYYKINITANNGDPTYTQICEMYLFLANSSTSITGNVITLGGQVGLVILTATQEGNDVYLPATSVQSFLVLWAAGTDMAPHDLTSYTSHYPYVVTCSTDAWNAWWAFSSGNPTHGWISEGGDPHSWLQIDIGFPVILGSYAIQGIVGRDAMGDVLVMLGSNDGVTWDALDNTRYEKWSGTEEIYTYNCLSSATYRYFRVDYPTFLPSRYNIGYRQIGQLYLYAGTAPGSTPQIITFPKIQDVTVIPLPLIATSDSGLACRFFIVSGNAAIAADNTTLLFTGTGEVTIRAVQAGDSTFAPAPPVEQSFNLLEGFVPHDLTSSTSHPPFVILPEHGDSWGGGGWQSFDGSLSTWSGGVGYDYADDGYGRKAFIQVDTGGRFILTAYAFFSGIRLPQSYVFSWTLSGSNDGVLWTVLDVSPPNITWVTLSAKGNYVSVDANYRYFKFDYVQISLCDIEEFYLYGTSLTVYRQYITFPDVPNHITTDGPFDLEAYASSGLIVVYTIVSGPATVLGNVVTLTGEVGTVIIKASQDGEGTTLAAVPVVRYSDVSVILKTKQVITFPTIFDVTDLSPVVLKATSDSGLTVVYTIISGPASLSGSTVTFSSAGSIVIEANQPGNSTYSMAPPVQVSFGVGVGNVEPVAFIIM